MCILAASRAGLAASTVAALAASWVSRAAAQELEPRQYSNIPRGLNFLVTGYATSDGGVLVDPSIAFQDAEIEIDGPVVGYARSIALGDFSAKVDAGAAHVCLDGSATLDGQRVSRSVCGWSDAKVRLAVNFKGAPALRLGDFASYSQDLVIGASVQLGVPVGDYDTDYVVNIGSNRWSARTEVGFSKVVQRWLLELAVGGTFYEDNDEFRGSRTRQQEPIYSLQGHVVRNFGSGVWIALDATHYRGGSTKTDGLPDQNLQENRRLGLTVSIPINPAQSVKLYYSTGVSTRTGTDFDTFGAAWQYRWGGARRQDP